MKMTFGKYVQQHFQAWQRWWYACTESEGIHSKGAYTPGGMWQCFCFTESV